MAGYGAGLNRPLSGRGPSPGLRFTLYAILSVVVMFLDHRGGWLDKVRYGLNAAAYPLQLAVSSPSTAWHWLHASFESRAALRAQIAALQSQQRLLELRTLRYDALARENAQLRGLRSAIPPVADHWLAAEVVNVELNSLRQRLLINRGSRNGVFKGQAVLDGFGLLGQTTHVGPWSAEVILITDPEHAVPVEIERTGMRTIAVGTGDTTSIALPYLPENADVRPGDLLLTSGLGGIFPQGYPVARITTIHPHAVQPLAQVRAQPLARVARDREVMLVWFKPGHPAAPGTAGGDLPAGDAALQPLPVPHPAAAHKSHAGGHAGAHARTRAQTRSSTRTEADTAIRARTDSGAPAQPRSTPRDGHR